MAYRNGNLSLTAHEALKLGQAVEINTDGEAALSKTVTLAIGVATEDCASGALASIRLFSAGTFEGKAIDAITAGSAVVLDQTDTGFFKGATGVQGFVAVSAASGVQGIFEAVKLV